MHKPRAHQRVPYSGKSWLLLDGRGVSVQVLDLSKGGVLMRMPMAHWFKLNLDRRHLVDGRLQVDKLVFNFKASIIWTTKQEKEVRFGLSFQTYDEHILIALLERLSVVDTSRNNYSFNI